MTTPVPRINFTLLFGFPSFLFSLRLLRFTSLCVSPKAVISLLFHSLHYEEKDAYEITLLSVSGSVCVRDHFAVFVNVVLIAARKADNLTAICEPIF
jgi:hypothetical protein